MPPALQLSTLEALEGTNYTVWVASLVRPYLGDDPIEIGSGIGTYAEFWLDSGLSRITVSDLEAVMVERLRERFGGDARVTVLELDLLAAPQAQHSSVVALNVLEHIEDDVAGLTAAARLLRPGGAIVLFVPAFPFAMSRFDRAVGHYRRYTAESLRRTVADAGLMVETIHYVNAPGLVAWTVGMRLLRMSPRDGIVLRSWDRAVVPAARRIETRWHPPFGQSLLAVGRVMA